VFATAPASTQAQTQLGNGLDRVVIPVEGMTCATCEIAVRHALKRIDGVKSAHVSVATKTATVDYEVAKTNPEQLVAAINSTGYRASLPEKMNDSTSMSKNSSDSKMAPAPGGAGENATITTADRISLFKLPLQCLAAPQIGCGSRAKPILLSLERDSSVSEAWLNRAGTMIAVVWKPRLDSKGRDRVAAMLKGHEAKEMSGDPRDKEVTEFLSGKGWYRGADVDRLSEEESGIIAARWVHRVQAKTALPKDKAEGLERALTDALSKCLAGGQQESWQNYLKTRLEEIAGKYLDQDQIEILTEAIEKGVQPLTNEN
jgi:copper chaperone CopZ